MILSRTLRFYLVFCIVVILLAFGLSSSYYGVWFVVGLLQHGVVRYLVTAFYLSGDDSNK